ncbi:unnamed protein product [Ilex paraguariensis]|uniref:WRKY domain-containing protein n=1 Tax=Ilex paraguariensis TaxID=185542 RepID=A0ABC8TN65_9AQUA
MDHRFNHHPLLVHEQEDSPTTPENAAESPLSGDDTTKTDTPSPRKSSRSVKKRVVSIPIGGLDGSRGKGEAYPPSDSWSWRKYGQKPIKGSPHPRGYYRCSSSKGCPARKQVERSHLDPTVLLITYSYDHNHPALPLTKHHHHHHPTTSSTTTIPTKLPPEEFAAFANQPDLEPDNHFAHFPGELGWFSDVGSTILESPVFVGPTCSDADVAIVLPIGEEDEPLFGDLGELPECSVVFRRRVETPFSGSTG